MNKLLLISLLVASFLPLLSYPATAQSTQAPIANANDNSVHIDSISINADGDKNKYQLNEEDRKRLIYEIGESGRDEVIKWVNREIALLFALLGIGLFAVIITAIRTSVNTQVSKQLESLDAARNKAIQATALTTVEIDRSRDALAEAKNLQITLRAELLKSTSEIEHLQEETEALKKSAESAYEDLRVDVKDDIGFLTTGDIVQTKWLQAIDATSAGENKVIDLLIIDLQSTDNVLKISAVEQLSYFDDDNGKIITAFEELLETESQTQFGAIILSKIGNLNEGDKAFDILSGLSDDLDSPNIAPVIGAIGNLQENRKRDPEFIGKIVEKLIVILENLNLKAPVPGSVEADETANKKNAVALALTYSGSMGEKAIPLLISMIDDSTDNEYRKSAAIALGNIGMKAVRAIPVLERLSKDPLLQMSSVAEEAIRNIQR